MKLAILTSTEMRHRYFARALARSFDVVSVGYEVTVYSPAETEHEDLTPDERRVVADHYAERTHQEEVYFGDDCARLVESGTLRVRSLEPGVLNSEATVDWLEGGRPDVVVVYGTNLIRSPMIDRFAGRMINMHLGLSPYYRGTATNFYPLVNEEPEYVGATIHLIDPGIDSGPILAHARPDISADDHPHMIGCKAIQSGIDKLIAILPEWYAERRTPVEQWYVPNPRLYLRRDFHPRHVVELSRKMEAGLITDYVCRASEVADSFRLID